MKKSHVIAPATLAGLMAAGALFVPNIAGAQEQSGPADAPAAGAQADTEMIGQACMGELQFSDELMAALNAETEMMAVGLTAAGFEVFVGDDDGWIYFDVNQDLTAEQEAQVDQIIEDNLADLSAFDAELESMFTDEYDGEPDADWDLTDEELAEINAETQRLIDELTAAGVPVEVIDDDGFLDFELPGDLSADQEAAVDRIFEADHQEFLATLSADEKSELNAENQSLIDELTAAGVPVETTEANGVIEFEIPQDLAPEQEAALDGVFGCADGGEEASGGEI